MSGFNLVGLRLFLALWHTCVAFF